MNEKLLEIAESVARIEATLDLLCKRIEKLEVHVEEDQRVLNQMKGIFRATAIIAAFFGSTAALAVELLVGR